jgi:hypothetical protein
MQRRFFCAASIALLVVSVGSTSAWSQTPAPASLVVPTFDDDGLQAAFKKRNAYIGLFNDTIRIADSWTRYRSWVDINKGPTGKERNIYGLYDVNAGSIHKAGVAASAFFDASPSLPPLDTAARDYIATLDPVVEVINKASAYFERQDYRDDGMKVGRDYHAALMQLMPNFLTRRATLEAMIDQLQAGLRDQELAFIERKDGRRYRYYSKRVLNAAAALPAFFGDSVPKARIPALDAAIASYAQAVRDYDDYLQRPDAQHGMMESSPRSFLAHMREFRDQVAAGRRPSSISQPIFMVSEYNSMINTVGNPTPF